MAIATAPTRSLDPAQLRRDLHLSRERMGRLVDVSAKTIQRWEEQGTLPASTRVRRHLAEISEIVELGLIVYTPDGFREFLTTPLPTFNHRTALQMMEQGHAEDVLGALSTDYEGLGA
jgi:transcriptional regulator with XRE-family HTH domain